MAFGRSNNSVEVPVTLGLQEALRLIAELRKQLNDGVKVGSGSFDFITKVLDKAQNQADKLGGKLGEAFKTSNSAKSFMREYQSMIEMLSTAKSKMGNLGFEEIKFSVKDLEVIDGAVKLILELSATLENIRSGKAIELINSSSVEGVENLRTQIGNLIKDTSGLTFDGLNKTLQEASNLAGAKVTEITDKINNLKSTINTISADGLSSVQAAVNSTSQNNSIGKSLVNALDINEANERLRQFANTLSDIPARLKSFTVGRDENVAKFVSELTDKLEKEYLRLINVVKDNRDKINSALTAILTNGHVGKNNLTNYTKAEYDSLINSEAILTAITTLNLDLNKVFDGLSETNIRGRMSALKAALKEGFDSFNTEGLRLEGLKSLVESLFNSIFEGLGETVVLKQKDVLNKLKEALNGLHIDPSALKEFGFDINNIKNGQDLASVYNQLKSSLDAYVQSLEALKQSLSSGELENAKRAQEELNNAITTAAKVQEESGSSAEGLLKLIDSLRKTIEDLVDKYNLLSGSNATFKTDGIEKGKQAADLAIKSLSNLEKKQLALSNVQSAVTRWMGFYQVLNLTKRAVKEMVSHITELDTVMTQIAVVTNMSQDDLWGQIGQYSEIARQYGVAIKGVYEVSLIYYQLGLNQGDVMNLTTETLKMARIAGIDYATAADYMTTAIRGFKLEMTEAARVTDVFSNLAAHTASDTEELATAISKTASSAEAVGASFEATSAMIATMVSVTRESATNIGTALKSVISRYGEMTSDPTKLVDSEGEEMSLNRVDKALRTIGITILDTNGQFRDFDDVILELGDKWDSLDKNAQRYIATIMAGNRQQSRFLALVGNVDEYRRALELANNSEDTGELLTLKTLDSIDAKMERMKVTIQEFYTSSGILDLYKNILDIITNVISAANDLPKIFGNIPAYALAMGMQLVNIVKNIATLIIAHLSSTINLFKSGDALSVFDALVAAAGNAGDQAGDNFVTRMKNKMQGLGAAGKKIGLIISSAMSSLGAYLSVSSLNKYGLSTSGDEDRAAAQEMGGSAFLLAGSSALSAALLTPGGVVTKSIAALVSGAISLIPSLKSASSMGNVTLARELELADKRVTKTSLNALETKGVVTDLTLAYDKLKSLSEAQYNSAEAMQEYHEYMNLLADSYPALVSAMEVNGDAIITLEALERSLAAARVDAAKAALENVKEEKGRLTLLKQSWLELREGVSSAHITLPGESRSAEDNYLVLRDWFDQNVMSMIPDQSIPSIGDIGKNNPMEAVLTAYNWAVEYLKDQVDYEDWVPEEQIKFNSDNIKEVYEANIENITNFINGFMYDFGMEWLDPTVLRQTYKNALLKIMNEDKSLNIERLTGLEDIKLEDITDVTKLDDEKLIEAIKHTREIALDGLDVITNNFETIDENISQASANVLVANLLNVKSTTQKGIDLNPYSKFLSANIARLRAGIDWTTAGVNEDWAIETYNSLVNYIDNYLAFADDLINNLKFSLFKGLSDLNKFLESHKFTEDNVDSNIIASILSDYTNLMSSIRKGFALSVRTNIGLSNENALSLLHLFDSGKTDDNLIAEILPTLQLALPKYLELMSLGYTIAAENYLNGLTTLFLLIGQLDEGLQLSLLPILSALDLTDTTSIDTAIESFTNLGLTDLVSTLTDIKTRVANNIGLSISSMVAEASNIAEEAEKALGNIGKGMDYSDALKAAQEIINKSDKQDRVADSLIEWNSDLNKWTLTSEALTESYQLVIGAHQERLSETTRLAKIVQDKGVQEQIKKLDENATQQEISNALAKTSLAGTEQNILGQTLQQLLDDFKVAYDKDNTLKWDTWVIDALTLYDEKELEFLQNYLQKSPLQLIALMDWTKFSGGTATASDKEWLTILLLSINATLEQIDTIFEELVYGNFDTLEQITGLSFSKLTKDNAIAALVTLYLNAIEEISSGKSVQQWSEATGKAIIEIANLGYSTIGRENTVHSFYQALHDLIGQGNYTLELYNEDMAKFTTKIQGIGREKATTDLLTGGFKLEEFSAYLNDYFNGLDWKNFFDESGKFIAEGYEGLFTIDEEGNYQISENHTVAEVLEFFNTVLNAGINKEGNLWKEYLGSEVDKNIADLNKADTGKLTASKLLEISSAKIGTRINVETLPEELRAKLDADGDKIYEVMSEYLRDLWLMSLDATSLDDAEARLALYEILEDIKAKNTKSSALSNLLSDTVTKDNAKAYLEAFYNQDTLDMDLHAYLTNVLKYEYDAFTNTYKATLETLDKLESDLLRAGADTEEGRKILALIDLLRYDLGEGRLLNAVISSIQNASDLSYEAWAELLNAILANTDEEIDWTNIASELETGEGMELNIPALLSLLEKLKLSLSDAANTVVKETLDTYSQNIQNAVSLISQGTTSFADMLNFADSYKSIVGKEVSVDDLFDYQPLQSAFTLNNEYLNKYILANAEKLGLVGQELTLYVNDMTMKVLALNIDIDNYINSGMDRESISGQQLKKLLSDWFSSKNLGRKITEYLLNHYLDIIESGDLAAVELMSNIAKDADRDLSSEEMQKYYAPLAEKYSSMASKLAELTVGLYIAEGEMRGILEKAGIVDETTGLVTSVKNMAKAYKDIYDNMKVAAGRTQKQLNSVYASYLTSSKKSEIDAISTLNDAMGMTYEALGELLGDYGKSLETFANNLSLYGLEDIGGGLVRINDFRAFASGVGLTDSNSEAYISAFKAYNDSLIALDNSTRNAITEEVQAIASANPGERVNLTTYWTSLDKAAQASINTSLLNYGGLITDGILRISEQADIKGIIDAILSLNNLKDNLLPDLIAALYDTLDATLTGMIDSVRSAAEGTISGEDFAKLHNWALQSYNIDIGLGVKTAEGYLMNEDALFALYNSVSKVDSMLAKSMIPDLSKVSSLYKTLPDLLKAYASATNEAKKSLLKAAISSLLRNPDNYNIMGGELPTTWLIAENFYGDAKKALTVTNLMINKGLVGVSDFSSLMQLIMSGNNAADRLQALEWMQSAPEFFVETSDGLMVNTAKMGIKNLKELNRMWIEAAEVLQLNGVKELEVYNLLYYGSESLQNADITDEEGNISAQKIKEIADAKTKLGENVKNLLDNIKINNESLYTYLDDSHLNDQFTKDMRDKLLTTLANTNWDFENFDDETLKMFKDAGLKGTVKIDGESGQITFEYNQDATTVEKVYTYGGTTFNDVNEYLEFLALTDKDGFTETSTGSGKNKTVTGGTYKVNDEIEVEIDITSGSVSYSFKYDGKTFTATNEASIMQAIADWVPKPEGGEIEGSQEAISYTVNVGEAKVVVKYDEKGNRALDSSLATESLAQEVDEKASKTIEISTPVTAVATIEELQAKLDSNALVNIAKDADGNVTVTWAEANGNIKSITLTPEQLEIPGLQEKINELLKNTGAILVITPDTTAVDDWYGTFNPTKVIKIKPEIVGDTSLHFNISYSKSEAKGNVALAAGTQSTLMGELGPELWVSGGHYYIAGRNGAEFVDLPKDAIVFNHLQTARLLGTGASGRGTPITSDRAAVALAHGDWNGGPAHDYPTSSTIRKGLEDILGGKNGNSGGNKNSDVLITLSDDAKSKLSSLISDALSKGFENLDWSDYEDELGSMMDEIKNTARINYRAFIDAYADQCDKTTSEINDLYFLAWQKDLEDSMDSEDIVSAAEGLSFYGDGSIGGSSSDWLSIIGDRARITDLVEQGIMSYDAATKLYFVTNAEALANAGVDISQIEGILEMMYDSLRSQYDLIVDYISNGLEGSLTAMDSKSLQSLVERMGITGLLLDFEQTVNGLKLSLESAISLYNELKKVDSIAALLTFNELVENLLDSNDNYKTMTSLLSHIEDLSLKIQDANSYSDERIKLYTEELALAKEIAAVRATSADESMSWYDESIPAGMLNVLDYRQSWADSIDMMRDAQETGVFDFSGLINTAKLINSQAQTLGQTLNFCGYELNGTSEAIDAFITAAANSLGAVTNDNGTNFGVVLEKFGADLTDGAASYENSATSAMQTFAKSQILILDGLIQMFEMIVAMESFKDVDEDDNGLLDWKELFNLDELEENSTEFALYIKTEFKTAAQLILDNAGSNEDLLKALTSVKVNGNTMQELLEYATGAIDKLTYSMTAGDYLKAMSVFYNLLASGDYDLDNIASSLKEALATSGSDFKGTIEYGDFVLDMKYGVTISKTSTGTYKSKSGLEYPTAAEACKATVLEEAGLENDLIVWSADKEVASGTVTYKSFSVEIIADTEGARYNYNGVAYNSLEDATMAAWNAAGGELGTQLTFDEWKIQQGITIVTTVSEVDTSNISKSLIDKLVGTSWQEIKAKWDAATGDKEAEEEFKIEYGFTLDGASEADFNEMKERLGITENRMELTLAITNLDEIAAEFASKMTNITLNPTSADATGSATVTADTTEAVTSVGAVEEAINKVIKAIEYLNTLKVAIDKGTAEADMLAIKDATKNAEEAVGKLDGAVSGLTTLFGYLNGTLNTLQGYLSSLSNSTISINAVGHEVLNTIANDLHSIWEDIKNLKDKEVNGLIVLNITTGGGEGGGVPGATATGNVIGNDALAAGSRQVLMGELGPELYVTGGRYYVAGQGGAEFVNLPNDAIVFNHLQTRKLLSTGAAGRGKPVTNEKAATSLATGNIMGLAMANALQTLATLKLLRAMWQSLANASITDMVGLANMKDTESSSDSGGNKIDRKAWIETLEKWYNWLQKIAELEKEINYEEQLRNTLETRLGPKGKELYESLKRELEMIKQQYAVLKSLVDSRREYFEARRAQLNSSVFGKFYLFDEHGQLFYTRGTKFEFGKTAEYVAAQKAAQVNGGNGATTATMTNTAAEMTKHTAEWNKSIGNLALAIYNTRASNQASRLSDGSISYKLNHYETIDKALQMALTMYRIDENGKATYLGNSTAKGDPLAYSDVSGRLWNIWELNIGVEFDRLQSGEKLRSNMDLNALNASSEYKKLLSQTIQDTAKAVGQEVGGGSAGGGAAGANPPRSELAEITKIEGGFAALMELWARDPQTLEPKYTPAEQYAIALSLGFGNYMLYDQSGNKIEPGENGLDDTFYTSALQALTDNLDADREEMQSLYDSIEEDEKKLLELELKLNEILLAIRDNQIDVENKILDAIEAREQAIIDELSDTKEVLEDNADKYINGLNEALSNELRMYLSNKSLNELESLRRQLAILQRSGGSASQINSLLQQIDAKEQENYFDAQQLQIDAILAASDLEIERLDKLIEIMETTLEYSKEHGLLWAEVSLIMQLDDAVIMDFLLSNTAEYLASSALQQSATYDELLSMVNQWTAYRDDLNKYRPLLEDMEVGLEDIMANIFSTDANVEDSNVISAIVGANVQVAQGMQAVAAATGATALSGTGSNSTAGTGTTSSSGSVKGSGSTETSAYANWLNGMGDALGTTANWMTAIQAYYKGDSSKSMAALTGALALQHYDKAASQPGGTAAKTWVASNDYVYDQSTKLLERYAKWNLDNIAQDLQDINDPNGKYKDMPDDWKQNKIKVYQDVLRLNGRSYSSGGSVDYTGLAMVHGTPTRPEYFLDAEETKMWKSDILSPNSSSLTSRLLALREILNGIESASSHINNSTDNGVIIEKAEVNVDVALLANDYDARRAGDTIMDEILQIARKTGVSSVRR